VPLQFVLTLIISCFALVTLAKIPVYVSLAFTISACVALALSRSFLQSLRPKFVTMVYMLKAERKHKKCQMDMMYFMQEMISSNTINFEIFLKLRPKSYNVLGSFRGRKVKNQKIKLKSTLFTSHSILSVS